jgi:hypothetical protein
MGWGVFIAYVVVLIAAAVATYYIYRPSSAGMTPEDMAPNSIDAFNVTLAQEGTVVPMIFGILRINTNLLWYGNLIVEGIYEEIDTDHGDKWVLKGYTYYLSLHHAIGIGILNLKAMYFDDKAMTIDAAPSNPYSYTSTWISRVVSFPNHNMPPTTIYHNPGCSTASPTYTSTASSPAMKPVSHLWMPSIWVGENVSNAPTFHLIVDKYFPSSHPLSFPRHSVYGSNPASVVYEILLAAGNTADDIDEVTFEAAAQAFDFRDYYISLTLSSQDEWRSHLVKILSNCVDATLRKNWASGKYELLAHDNYVDTNYGFTEQDFVEFSFTRPGWDETYNDLRANYTDRTKDYTRRTIRAYNSASIQMLGYARQRTVDLTPFNDVTIASKRLWELLKRLSYPTAILKFKTGLWGARAPGPGELVGINHNEYGLTGTSFRVLDKRINEDDQNYIDWICEEDINNTFTLGYQEGGSPGWVAPDYGLNVLVHQGVFEMPNSSLITTDSKTFICLAARVEQEVGFDVEYSSDGSSYTSKRIVTEWAMYGTLDETYDDETDEVDDDYGILFTPYNPDYAPSFDNLSRTQLYDYNRVAVCGNELMLFQTMTPEGEDSYRLMGVVRGFLNTPIQQHNSGAAIWLIRINTDALITVNQTDFYFKFLPQGIGGGTVDIGDATAIHVTATGIAAKPYPPYSIKAVRTGTQVVFTWLPVVKYSDGAGTLTPNENTDPTNLYEGDFYFDASAGSHDQYVDGLTLTITQTGSFTVTIKNRVNSVLSDGATISVGSADGTYIGPEITYT